MPGRRVDEGLLQGLRGDSGAHVRSGSRASRHQAAGQTVCIGTVAASNQLLISNCLTSFVLVQAGQEGQVPKQSVWNLAPMLLVATSSVQGLDRNLERPACMVR